PIAFLAGTYVTGNVEFPPKDTLYFEPSAGNGLLTIAFQKQYTIVNEIDEIRLENLKTQGYLRVTNENAITPFVDYVKKFDGVITNPPFGSLIVPIKYDKFEFNTLDHLMALRALDTMKDTGRAAIIIGGHTSWDDKNRIQAGKNRIFFNYLYSHYNVDDVLNLDGHKLYSRQGTSFDVRLILISGRKKQIEGNAPLKTADDIVIDSFDELLTRIIALIPENYVSPRPPSEFEVRKQKYIAMMNEQAAEKQLKAENIDQNIEHPKGRERFSPVREIDRSQITTDPKTFQGRQSAYANETVDKIIGEGFDKSQDPIIVWYDELARKYVVISGHSRWQASQMLYDRGDKSLKMMPVKVFIGDKDDAIDYAVIESNRSGKSEGMVSDILAYKKAMNKGMNKLELLRYFKPESYLNLLKDLSLLNINGRFIEYLSSASEQSFPYLKRNAQWVGNLRRIYPQLTDSHEVEIFDYLYKNGSIGLKTTKETLYNLIDRKVMTIDFNPSKPLNLSNMPSVNVYSDPIREQVKEVEREIADLSRQRSQKEELVARAKNEGMFDAIDRISKQISDINIIILRKIEEKQRLDKMAGQVEREVSFDLFSTPEPPQSRNLDLLKAKAKARLRLLVLKRKV
ncbi:MAG: hypothetical protein WCK09_13670, partial [Bacteroidota bacterium]